MAAIIRDQPNESLNVQAGAYPALTVGDFRSRHGIDSKHAAERLQAALRLGYASVQGWITADDAQTPWASDSVEAERFASAVFAQGYALLVPELLRQHRHETADESSPGTVTAEVQFWQGRSRRFAEPLPGYQSAKSGPRVTLI